MASIKQVRAGARRARALGDPTRLSIALELTEKGSLGVGQLAELIGRHQSLVSRHCARLNADGLVVRHNPTGHPRYELTDYGREFLAFVMRGR